METQHPLVLQTKAVLVWVVSVPGQFRFKLYPLTAISHGGMILASVSDNFQLLIGNAPTAIKSGRDLTLPKAASLNKIGNKSS